MNRLTLRHCLPFALLAISASVSAIGLGELRGQPALGERLQLEIGLLGGGKEALDASCYRLVQPSGGGDLPWLRKAVIGVRNGAPPILEIKSDIPLREPILQLSVQVVCGNDIVRDYVILASPAKDIVPAPSGRATEARESVLPVRPRESSGASRPTAERPAVTPRSQAPRLRPIRRSEAPAGMSDRLMLSTGIDVGEPSLRLAMGLGSSAVRPAAQAGASEAQREVLRLEFRMLMALHDQANTQMAAAEKLRNMETTLAELEQKTLEVGQRSDKAVPEPANEAVKESVQPEPVKPAPVEAPLKPPVAAPVAAESPDDFMEWGLYALLLAAVLGLGGLLGWRNYRERQARDGDVRDSFVAPGLEVDPQRDEEHDDDSAGVDLPVEPAAVGAAMKVDVELDGHAELEGSPQPPESLLPAADAQLDSVFSVNATTLDEHFEANPVMELADIMLSFGRVKGAAQALQEYIDNNPQEALQPWIRLMDVYKMAGMRNEFEAVALNLNQNFNVEIQQWDGADPSPNHNSLDLILDDAPQAPVPLAPRPECLEDMPRIMASVTQFWSSGDVVGFLYQLLRDNRGGKRVGFALPVVEEILFLIELKETSNRMEREVENS